jgi:spermidine synthase
MLSIAHTFSFYCITLLEIFRDFGVIEQYPQRWSFHPNAVVLETEDGGALYAPEQITFELVQDPTTTSSAEDNTVLVQWAEDLIFDDRGRNYVRRIFRQHLRKLYRFQNIHYDLEEEEKEGETEAVGHPAEWKQIQAYYKAVRSALQYAIHALKNEGDETGVECREGTSSNEGECDAAHLDIYGIHYDDLLEEEDDLNYIFPTCETTQLVEFSEYRTIEDLQTNYQKLWFMTREEDNDVCMNLENTLQICSNYRPHYHEFFVHFPARFIENIERVIFIGGGDSMLLHEVLKYPSLQKVVGLELDQQVTRKSFQHFKSQPHWDNDKVEWWYGDATKSLPLLPRDYWGSFDLVLVDLSETVMSFSVTKTMDIFSALSLLLKPEGIMVKNEPYIDQFSDFFDHTIQIFYGTPKICTQVLVMGSNQVDFLHHPTKDHKVDRLLLEPLDNFKSLKYKYMHDYRKTDARQQGKCSDEDIQGSIEHGGKAGIVEILEADNVSYSFETEHLESTLFNVAKGQGLTPLSPPMVQAKGPISALVMKEGYIVARSKPSQKYIAFDIHWWGAFSKMESLRAALLSAVGSGTSSFYRVVAGGMHGTSTWDDDKDAIGIEVAQTRNCQPKEWKELDTANDGLASLALKTSLKETLLFLPKKQSTVAVVLCGFESQGPCTSADTLSEIQGGTLEVEPIWACPELANYTEASLDTFDHMFECEKTMLGQLMQLVAKNDEDIDMFVIDPSAPRAMGQVFNSIWAVMNNREAVLADKNVFVAFSKSGVEQDGWRKNMLERYRKESHFFPVSRADVSIMAGSDQEYRLHIAAVDDRYFFQHLHEVESNVRSHLLDGKTAFQMVEAKSITGGMHYYDSEYDVRLFSPESYDAQPALAQAASQEPLGRQGIFQFEFIGGDDETTKMLPIEQLNQALQETILDALGIEAKHIQRWSTFKEVGDGAAVVAIFPGGNLVFVWDGRTHVDLNLYTSDQSKAVADLFVDTFAKKTFLTKTLRDDQPRGPGRVVQFDYEIDQ